MSIVSFCYQLIVLALSPLVAAVFVFFPRGRARLAERFGLWGAGSRQGRCGEVIWFHAASNGEVRGLLPLISKLRLEFPEIHILLTATSVSAFGLLEGLDVEIHLAPFDCGIYYHRAFGARRLHALVVAETEIWPGMLAFARRKNIKVVLVNARISDYTIKAYSVLSPLLRGVTDAISRVCCADALSVDRFKMMGAVSVSLTGNMKYDTHPSIGSSPEVDELLQRFCFSSKELPVVVLGSLHPGEEGIWLNALKKLSVQGKAPACILAPRHMEKVDYFVQQAREFGLSPKRFSEIHSSHSERHSNFIILDVFGMLEPCYAMAALAFVGGSLIDIGGHNPLEAAAYGAVIAMGPYDSTVSEITAQLEAARALVRISPGQDVLPLIEKVLSGDVEFEQSGERAKGVWQVSRGATERVMSVLVEEGVLRTKEACDVR